MCKKTFVIYWFFYKKQFYHVQETSSSKIYRVIKYKQEGIAVTMTSRSSSNNNSIADIIIIYSAVWQKNIIVSSSRWISVINLS